MPCFCWHSPVLDYLFRTSVEVKNVSVLIRNRTQPSQATDWCFAPLLPLSCFYKCDNSRLSFIIVNMTGRQRITNLRNHLACFNTFSSSACLNVIICMNDCIGILRVFHVWYSEGLVRLIARMYTHIPIVK